MKGIAVVPGGLGTNTIALAINKGAWKKISAADRAAIAALSGEVLSQQAGTAQKGEQGLRCVQGRRHQCGADDGRGRGGTGRRSCACPLHLGRGCQVPWSCRSRDGPEGTRGRNRHDVAFGKLHGRKRGRLQADAGCAWRLASPVQDRPSLSMKASPGHSARRREISAAMGRCGMRRRNRCASARRRILPACALPEPGLAEAGGAPQPVFPWSGLRWRNSGPICAMKDFVRSRPKSSSISGSACSSMSTAFSSSTWDSVRSRNR